MAAGPMRTRDWTVLAVLVAAAVALRLVRLAGDPLWFDEAATLGIASMPWPVVLGPMAAAESSPPGYYALAKLWSALFGADIVAVRILSVAAGAATVAVVWRIAFEAFGPRAAPVAGAFLVFAATHVRMSQDGRVYALLALVAALALYAAHRLILAMHARRSGIVPALGLGLGMAAGIWLHPTAGIIALTLNAAVLAGLPWRRGGVARCLGLLALADAVALVLAAPPIIAVLQHVLDPGGYVDRWILPPGLLDTAEIYVIDLAGPFLGPGAAASALLQATLLAVAVWAWWRHGAAPLVLGLAAMLVAGGLLMPLVSQFRPVMVARTIMFLLVPLALLIGAGAAALPRRWAAGIALPILLLAALGAANYHLLEHRKERWDLAAAHLAQAVRPGEPIVVTEGAFVEIPLAWHLRRHGAALPRVLVAVPQSDLEILAARTLAAGTYVAGTEVEPAALCEALAGAPALWLVMRELPPPVQEDRDFTRRVEIRAALREAGARMVASHETVGVDIEKWEVPACRPPVAVRRAPG
jgi:mannosyltransferase